MRRQAIVYQEGIGAGMSKKLQLLRASIMGSTRRESNRGIEGRVGARARSGEEELQGLSGVVPEQVAPVRGVALSASRVLVAPATLGRM